MVYSMLATHLRIQTFITSLRGSSAAEACYQQQVSPLGNPPVTKQEPSAELREKRHRLEEVVIPRGAARGGAYPPEGILRGDTLLFFCSLFSSTTKLMLVWLYWMSFKSGFSSPLVH